MYTFCLSTSYICLSLCRSQAMFFFFFSSRRRHTRCSRDWSSDVCSSDLPIARTLRDESWLCIPCRGTMHRALFDAAIRESRNAKSQGASEPRLILIKRAERTSSKSEGRSNMQDIQGTSAEEPGLGSGNPPGMCKSRGRYRHDTDQAVVHIPRKRKQNSLLLRSAQLLPQNAPI